MIRSMPRPGLSVYERNVAEYGLRIHDIRERPVSRAKTDALSPHQKRAPIAPVALGATVAGAHAYKGRSNGDICVDRWTRIGIQKGDNFTSST